jgi:uncharacterized phage protein gp47/JayE
LSRPLFRSLLALLALGTVGCAQTFDATTVGVPVTMASDAGQVPQGTAFKVEATALWFMWGIVPISNPSLQKTLAAELVGGRSVANLKIRTHTSLIDGLVTVLTVGILAPRSVTYEGVIVGAPPVTP